MLLVVGTVIVVNVTVVVVMVICYVVVVTVCASAHRLLCRTGAAGPGHLWGPGEGDVVEIVAIYGGCACGCLWIWLLLHVDMMVGLLLWI